MEIGLEKHERTALGNRVGLQGEMKLWSITQTLSWMWPSNQQGEGHLKSPATSQNISELNTQPGPVTSSLLSFGDFHRSRPKTE